MPDIKFSADEKRLLINKIQRYFESELDHEIGQFDADFLLDFFAKEIGAFYYNRGLHDAQAVLESKLDTISDAIYEIEQPTSF
ncbi:DUF2164 domain-containing protein [Alkalimarinus sediminis]|uniref:DUF2164 domain-containing protein n=1 Tax=Alkalimarinus sediminis TaxID=1632866 RepID=A0A9E8HH88_9ALTE|nr:DUF2164 domain-containing protein [Alkalimarinus sediminis]UZW74147.1 DUF2164 domain-containing protein [Alkalimarinus sediminis]